MKSFNILPASLYWLFAMFLLSMKIHAYDTSIIATVNNRIITTKDFKNRLNLVMSSSKQTAQDAPRETKEQVLELLISEELQLLLGEEFGIKINAPALAAAVSDIEKQNGMKQGDLKRTLESNGVPFSVMERHIRATIIWREYIRERYGNLVQVSDHDVRRALREKEAAKSEKRFLLNEILIATSPSLPEDKARAKANRIHGQLSRGAQFTLVALQNSSAPTAPKGGELGWLPLSQIQPEAKQVVSDTPVGGFTQPIKTNRGYQIFLIRDRLDAGQNQKPIDYISFKQVYFSLPKDAFEFEIKEKMKSIESIARQIQSAGMADRLLAGKGAKIQNIDNIPVYNLPPEMKTLIGSTRVGHASKPVFTGDGAVMFVVTDHKTVNPEALSEDEIRSQLTEAKLQKVAAQELRNRRALAHVTIRDLP